LDAGCDRTLTAKLASVPGLQQFALAFDSLWQKSLMVLKAMQEHRLHAPRAALLTMRLGFRRMFARSS